MRIWKKTAGKLISTTEMIRQLTSVDSGGHHTSQQVQALIQGTESIFKDKMYGDLDVRGAFDGIRNNLA